MYNGSENNNSSNNGYTTAPDGNYNRDDSGNGYRTNTDNYMSSGYMRTDMKLRNEASSCRKWMIIAMALHASAMLLSIMGLPAAIVTFITMTRVMSFFDKARMDGDRTWVSVALWTYGIYMVGCVVTGFLAGFSLALKHKDEIQSSEAMVNEFLQEHNVAFLMISLISVVLVLYLLAVWIKAFVALKKY